MYIFYVAFILYAFLFIFWLTVFSTITVPKDELKPGFLLDFLISREHNTHRNTSPALCVSSGEGSKYLDIKVTTGCLR